MKGKGTWYDMGAFTSLSGSHGLVVQCFLTVGELDVVFPGIIGVRGLLLCSRGGAGWSACYRGGLLFASCCAESFDLGVVVPWSIIVYFFEGPVRVLVNVGMCHVPGLFELMHAVAARLLVELHFNIGGGLWTP